MWQKKTKQKNKTKKKKQKKNNNKKKTKKQTRWFLKPILDEWMRFSSDSVSTGERQMIMKQTTLSSSNLYSLCKDNSLEKPKKVLQCFFLPNMSRLINQSNQSLFNTTSKNITLKNYTEQFLSVLPIAGLYSRCLHANGTFLKHFIFIVAVLSIANAPTKMEKSVSH